MGTEELVYIHEMEGSVGITSCFNVSDKGFAKVLNIPCEEIDCLKTYCTGLINGILLSKGLGVRSVVFQPADSRCEDLRGEKGYPVTVFKICEERKEDFYQFHIFFDTKANTIRHGFTSKDWR